MTIRHGVDGLLYRTDEKRVRDGDRDDQIKFTGGELNMIDLGLRIAIEVWKDDIKGVEAEGNGGVRLVEQLKKQIAEAEALRARIEEEG